MPWSLFTLSMYFPCYLWLRLLPSYSQYFLFLENPAKLSANQLYINNESSTPSQCYRRALPQQCVFSHFSLFMWWIPLTDFHILTLLAFLGWNLLDHSVWSFWCVLRFYVQVFYWSFYIYAHADYWYVILFLCWVFIWFGVKVTVPLWNELGKVPSGFFFVWNNFRSIDINYSLKAW